MIRKPLAKETEERLKKVDMDGRDSWLVCGGQARLTSVATTRMLCEVQRNFSLGVLESYVLGKAYTAGALLTAMIKGNDRIKLAVQCGGPIGGYQVEAWAYGAVRGALSRNPIPLKKELESTDLNLLYGPGFLSVTRYLEGDKTPVSGDVALEYGNLAKDLAVYFHRSEQIPTLIDLSVQFAEDGTVSGAGGLLFQLLPGASEETVSRIEKVGKNLKPIGAWLENGLKMRDYVKVVCKDLEPQFLGNQFVGFSCPCTKQGFAQYLKTLPDATKEDIRKNGPFPLGVTCMNCGSVYYFTKGELEELL